jgi:hypothetical protein
LIVILIWFVVSNTILVLYFLQISANLIAIVSHQIMVLMLIVMMSNNVHSSYIHTFNIFAVYIQKQKSAKLDGAIAEQPLENMLNEFLPHHNFIKEDKPLDKIIWTDNKIEVVRQLSTELHTILFDHKPEGFPSSSIVHDNSYFFLDLFVAASTKKADEQREVK